MNSSDIDHPYYCSCPAGMEPYLFRELATLGSKPVYQEGGAFFRGSQRELYRAALSLRTANRILLRVKEFNAPAFADLERELRLIAWDRWVARGENFRIKAVSEASKLYHEGAIQERFAQVVSAKTGALWKQEEEVNTQLFVIKIIKDRCRISVDASGEPLSRRGYRLALAKAPLKETIAAGLLYASTWVPAELQGAGKGAAERYTQPVRGLYDPFCGSGTIPIEAALRARKIPPGLAKEDRTPRDYRFMHWPDFNSLLWEKTVSSFQNHILPVSPVVLGASDRDAGAVQASQENAARAGVLSDIEITQRSLSDAHWPLDSVVVTNPPYGVRVHSSEDLRNLYAVFGRKLKENAGTTVLWLDGWEDAARATGTEWKTLFRSFNGPLAVRGLFSQF